MCDAKPGKRRKNTYTVLLSVCLFLGVICACLLVALVLIGKNLATQKQCNNNNILNNNRYNNNSGTFTTVRLGDPSEEDTSEISVKIVVDDKKEDVWSSGMRLPRDVEPSHYDLFLFPNLTHGFFNGSNNMTIKLKDRRNHLIVHAFKLDILKVQLFDAKGVEIEVLDHHPDSVHQFHVVDLEESLLPGLYYLYFEFGGTMDNIIGFYRSSYENQLGQKRYMATSKLEPTYARQAFPCFDEPNYKAKYTVQIVKPKDEEWIALSNMNQVGDPEPIPVNNHTVNGTQLTVGHSKYIKVPANSSVVRFAESVPMSTYLSCFIVCDFKYIETTAQAAVGKDVHLRVYASQDQLKKTKFALDVAKNVTQFYIKYFEIEYPLPKLDMIAIPDFVSGATEHWGLVTYRETALLLDEKASSVAFQERVATVVAHETAHMWFGNLVTLNWWNDLWLNEGFATYMQFKSTDQAFPDWGLMDKFLLSQIQPVLQFDASIASHPIVVTVETPDQITEIFDVISYNKGASIIRMLENAMGEEKFRQSISNYLKKFKYGNAVTKNLWDEMQKIEQIFNIAEVMDTWTIQMGFPLITVVKNNDEYTLTQKRFLANPELENQQTPSPLDYKWTIPVTYVTDNSANNSIKWFDKSAPELKVKIPNAKWVKFNERQIGYYRVNYPIDMWNVLSENIKDMSISDKANLLDDAFSIAMSGILPYKIPLDMTRFLKEEENYIVWSVAANKLYELKRLVANEDAIFEKLQKYIRSIVGPLEEKLTWVETPSDTTLQKFARDTILKLACSADSQAAIAEASELFNNWIDGKGELSPNTKDSILIYGMVNGTASTWEKLLEVYKKETDAQEKTKLMMGLTSIRDATVLKKLVELAKDESFVRGQDYFECLQTISVNPVGTPIVWDYVREHWPELVERFTLNNRYMGNMLPFITRSFTSQVRLHEMEDFYKRYPEAGAGATARKQSLENIKNRIKWLEKYKRQVQEWLEANV